MKKTILFLILVLPLVIQGQVINHFDNPDSKWQQSRLVKTEQGEWYAGVKFMYYFDGDTLIDGEKWLRFFYDAGSSIAPYQPYSSFGLIKSEGKKVYHFSPSSSTTPDPILMYDFSLEKGDTFEMRYYSQSLPVYVPFLVSDVDSVLINDIPYKRIKFENPVFNGNILRVNEVWIEGIGSLKRPFSPIMVTTMTNPSVDSMVVSCTFSNNQYLWQHPDYSECDIADYLTVFENNPLLELSVYPNPTTDLLNIEFELNNPENISLTIYDLQGKIIATPTIGDKEPGKHKITINTAHLPKGIYLIQMDIGKEIVTKKIVKL